EFGGRLCMMIFVGYLGGMKFRIFFVLGLWEYYSNMLNTLSGLSLSSCLHMCQVINHREVYPPSTIIFAPVIKLALELHRNATTFATSLGSPILCIGTRGIYISCIRS